MPPAFPVQPSVESDYQAGRAKAILDSFGLSNRDKNFVVIVAELDDRQVLIALSGTNRAALEVRLVNGLAQRYGGQYLVCQQVALIRPCPKCQANGSLVPRRRVAAEAGRAAGARRGRGGGG